MFLLKSFFLFFSAEDVELLQLKQAVNGVSGCCGASVSGPEGPGLKELLPSYFLICSPV